MEAECGKDALSDMKRILFVIGQLRIGGVSKALIELLRNIEGQYDVSLLCFDHEGKFFDDVPKSVTVLPTTHLLELTERSAADMRRIGMQYAFIRYGFSFAAKKVSKRVAAMIWTRMVGKIEGEYDVAISFTHPMPDSMFCNLGGEFVLHCVHARKKAVFIHCDFSSYGGNSAYNRWLLQQFDSIAAVSESVGRKIAQCIPSVEERVVVVRNCHDFDAIRRMAEDDPIEYAHQYNFVTVARLSEEKGLLRCIPVFAQLHEQGEDVSWTIVGGGPQEQQLRTEISNYGAQGYIALAGEHRNSYRYIKNADYLLLPSFHEAAPMVYDEAACLGVPIVTTQLLSAIEMVEKRGIGIVCANSPDGIVDGIRQAIKNFKTGVHIDISNAEALAGFKKLCEG